MDQDKESLTITPYSERPRRREGHPPGPIYRRRFGFMTNPAVRREIAGLDPLKDCQRIAYLLTSYEFSFEMTHSLELALLHTYGSRSVAGLLARTRQFEKRAQKRYDDTRILIEAFLEAGWDDEQGHRALLQMNKIHARFKIPNEDYLFVLWCFIDFPCEWIGRFGWRPLTAREELAWLNFWVGVGRRMGFSDIPESKADYDRFIAAYEQSEMIPNEDSRTVAAQTVALFKSWLPSPLRPLVWPVARCLIRPAFARAVGVKPGSAALKAGVFGALNGRGLFRRLVAPASYPVNIRNTRRRTYPEGAPAIEVIGPYI